MNRCMEDIELSKIRSGHAKSRYGRPHSTIIWFLYGIKRVVRILTIEMSEILSPAITKSMANTDKLVLCMLGPLVHPKKAKISKKKKKLRRNQTNRMNIHYLRLGVLAALCNIFLPTFEVPPLPRTSSTIRTI